MCPCPMHQHVQPWRLCLAPSQGPCWGVQGRLSPQDPQLCAVLGPPAHRARRMLGALQPAAVGTCQPLLGSWCWSLNSQCTPVNANLDFERAVGRAGSS